MMRVLSVWVILLVSVIVIDAQGEDGKNKTTPPKTPSVPAKPKKSTAPVQKNIPKKQGKLKVKPVYPKTEKFVSASIQVTVNQGGTSVELDQIQAGIESNVDSSIIDNAGETILYSPLKPGNYVIRVRKNGFYEESKSVNLKGGKPVSVNIDLKPSAGFITITGDTEGTEVEVKGVGIFTGKIEELVLAPQKYEVMVTKDGFETSTQIADIRLGQTTIVSITLQPVSFAKLLQNAENDFLANRYKEVISNCRLILNQNPDEPRANLLMGYSYFYTERPRESRFYLTRVLSLRNEVEFAVKIYQKEKNSETLTDGVLKINRTKLSFSSAKRPELNFTIAPSSNIKLEINQDGNNSNNISSLKPDSIEMKGLVDNGKKIEKKNIRLFPRQAFARVVAQNKAEIASCTGCNNGGCLCQKEIQAIYELLLNWKSGSYPRQIDAFSSVTSPSSNFTQFDSQSFSLEVPDNWQMVDQSNSQIWFAPNGGYSRRNQNTNQYAYAVNIGLRPIKTNDLFDESRIFYMELLSGNNYLEQQNMPKEIIISGRKGLASNFAGFSVETGTEESVQIYTTFTSKGNFFWMIMVTPFNEQQKYKSVFRHILDSVRLK